MSATVAAPRAAATVLVVRDGPEGLEVLLLRRAEKGDHNSGAWVFPGGLVDADDRAVRQACTGLDDAQASARLGLPEGGLDHFVAAVRECFEEAGVLLALDRQGAPARLDGPEGQALLALRGPLHRGECSFASMCREHGLTLPMDRLHYVAHWLTPRGRPKRFDTRFFLAVLPPDQETAHDAVETTDHVWLRPAQALSPANQRRLMTPTRAMLEMLAGFEGCASLVEWVHRPRSVACVLPRLAAGPGGVEPILPDHPAYDEVGLLDPDGRGLAQCALQPGTAVALSPHVLRLTAADGLANSYLVCTWSQEASFDVLVDPSTTDEAHLRALLQAAGGALRWVLTSHDDPANVEAARSLMARTGAGGSGPGLDAPSPAVPAADVPGLRWQPGAGWWWQDDALLFCGTRPVAGLPAQVGPAWAAPGRGFLVALHRSQEPS